MVWEAPTPKWLNIISVVCFIGWTVASFLAPSKDNWRLGFLSLISGAFGFVLKGGPFGFTCSFRTLLVDGNFSQTRGMILMMFFATSLIEVIRFIDYKHPFTPLFKLPGSKYSSIKSQPAVGVSIALGAFIFGMGMQIGSGCASGTLVGMGEGFAKAWIVIWFFIAGATLACIDPIYEWWSKLPKNPESILLPWWGNLLLLIGLYLITFIADLVRYLKKRREQNDGKLEFDLGDAKKLMTYGDDPSIEKKKRKSLIKTVLVDFLLGVIVAAFFLCVGSTIGVMGVFPYIGARFLQACKVHVENWKYFSSPIPANLMDVPVFQSDVYLIFGSFLAATIFRNFGVAQRNNVVDFIKAPIGGLLMGIGARMANGCNIGSMLSGITGRSIHGYVWMICAIIGSGTVLWIEKGIMYLVNRHKKDYDAV